VLQFMILLSKEKLIRSVILSNLKHLEISNLKFGQ
jgi:hypothetical protein